MNATGKMIKQFNMAAHETIQWGADLPAGIYLVEIKQGTYTKTERLVKF